MKTLSLCVLILMSTCATGQAANPRPDVGDGRVSWCDLTTVDMQKSQAFYTGLFGWTFSTGPGSNHVAEIIANAKPIGSIRVQREKPVGQYGVVYIQVPDIRASCKRAVELGGSVPEGFPFNLSGERGAIALVVDPAGQQIGMYSRSAMPEK